MLHEVMKLLDDIQSFILKNIHLGIYRVGCVLYPMVEMEATRLGKAN